MLHHRPSDRLLTNRWELRYGFSPAQHILVVESEGYVARRVAYQLEHVGYEVLTCGRAYEARELIEQIGLPHAAVVDSTLPDTDGEELCRWMSAFSDIPTLVLIPADAPETSLLSACAYADDSLRKPFEPCQVVECVRRLMRFLGESNLPVAPLVQVDDGLAVDFVRQRALLCDHRVSLSPLETKIMHILMRRAGHLVTVDFLVSRLGRIKSVDAMLQDTVHTSIEALHQKIGTTSRGIRYIHNVPSVGYIFMQQDKTA